MTRNFLKEFSEICNAIDGVIPKPQSESISVRLYNIHKESIPVGFDKPIIFNATPEQAIKEIDRLVRIEKERRENSSTDVFYMFRPVAVDATQEEKSVYYNDCDVML